MAVFRNWYKHRPFQYHGQTFNSNQINGTGLDNVSCLNAVRILYLAGQLSFTFLLLEGGGGGAAWRLLSISHGTLAIAQNVKIML